MPKTHLSRILALGGGTKKTLLFPDFLSSPEAYAAAESFWQAYFAKLAQTYRLHLTPYLKNQTAGGQPLRDGNPIYNARLSHSLRAIRIIQTEPETPDEYYLNAWLDTLALDPQTEPLQELVISLTLSEETLARCEHLALDWWLDGLEHGAMEEKIAEAVALLKPRL
jgi:hypothetical protein